MVDSGHVPFGNDIVTASESYKLTTDNPSDYVIGGLIVPHKSDKRNISFNLL